MIRRFKRVHDRQIDMITSWNKWRNVPCGRVCVLDDKSQLSRQDKLSLSRFSPLGHGWKLFINFVIDPHSQTSLSNQPIRFRSFEWEFFSFLQKKFFLFTQISISIPLIFLNHIAKCLNENLALSVVRHQPREAGVKEASLGPHH